MESARSQAHEVEEVRKLSFLETLRAIPDAIRMGRIKVHLDKLEQSGLPNMDLASASGRMEFKRVNSRIEVTNLQMVNDEEETKTVIGGHWSEETGVLDEAFAYQIHYSGGREVAMRGWSDSPPHVTNGGQLTPAEVLYELKLMTNSFLPR